MSVCVFLFAVAGQAVADSLSDAQFAYFSGDYAKAERLFRPLAEQGNSSAQSALGLMYGLGQGVEKNHVEAEKWFRLAAKQRHALMQRNDDHLQNIQLSRFLRATLEP